MYYYLDHLLLYYLLKGQYGKYACVKHVLESGYLLMLANSIIESKKIIQFYTLTIEQKQKRGIEGLGKPHRRLSCNL